MKKGAFIVSVFLIVAVGYAVYLVVGMSDTYPPIKEYYLNVCTDSFEGKLAGRVDSTYGWSLEKGEVIKSEDVICHTATLSYNEKGQKLVYDVRYCFQSKLSDSCKGCVRLAIIGAFDYVNKNGGYKISDDNVVPLISKLENTLLDKFATACK